MKLELHFVASIGVQLYPDTIGLETKDRTRGELKTNKFLVSTLNYYAIMIFAP